MQTYTPTAIAGTFVSDDGQMIVIADLQEASPGLLIGSDPKKLREQFVAEGDFSTEGDVQNLKFIEVPGGTWRELKRQGDELTVGDTVYRKVDGPPEVAYDSCPTVQRFERLHRLNDGRFFVAVARLFGKFWLGYEQVYIGPACDMHSTPVTGVAFRHLPRIETAEGTMCLAHGTEPAYWQSNNGEKIEGEPLNVLSYINKGNGLLVLDLEAA